MATLHSGPVTALLNAGADAMDNLFDVDFHLPDSDLSSWSSGSIRCIGFDPPIFTLKTYDAPYKTTRVKRSAGKIEGDRSFKIQFRLDAYYNIYRTLLRWRSACMQPATGFASTRITPTDPKNNPFLGSIDVTSIGAPVSQEAGEIGVNSLSTYVGLTEPTAPSILSTVSTKDKKYLAWRFFHVWVMDVTPPAFKTGGGDPQIITAAFGFGSFADPQISDSLTP
jgi:hypothetical protein